MDCAGQKPWGAFAKDLAGFLAVIYEGDYSRKGISTIWEVRYVVFVGLIPLKCAGKKLWWTFP
jgi:hypothetical protein